MTCLLVVGDVVWDRDVTGAVHRIAPDAPVPVLDVEDRHDRPGGAGLTARLLARDGAEVRLAAPLAQDAGAARLRELTADDGVAWLPLGTLDTTRSVTRVRSAGQSLLRLDEGSGQLDSRTPVDLAGLRSALRWADAVVVCDYGGGVTRHPGVRDLLTAAAGRRVTVWDPHPRGGPPVPGVAAVTPNRREALDFLAEQVADRGPAGGLDRAAAILCDRWAAGAVAATDGEAGAHVAVAGAPSVFVPSPFAVRADPCGAGDRFTACLATQLARGAAGVPAVTQAVALTAAWLRDGGVGACSGPVSAGSSTGRRTGGVLVATGGCFDVLHAGHVSSLRAARELGDRLVVLLNSDDSVRRLKGPGRPVHTAEDRVRVLKCLECVDEVRVFDEDSPHAALGDLRPDVWAKGADHADGGLPEADLVESWGGRVVLLPLLPGHSTTRILAHNT